MMKEKIVEKINKVEVPEIEMYGHKNRLRSALLSSEYFKTKNSFNIFQKPLFISAPALTLVIILVLTIIQPKITEAKVLQIAKNDPEIKKMIEEKNMTLGDIKIKNGKAYVVINPSSDSKTDQTSEIKIQKINSEKLKEVKPAIIEINISKKKVEKIDSINDNDFASLNESEQNAAKNIAGTEEVVSDIIPKEAKIEKVSPVPQTVNIIKKDDEIKVVPKPGNEKKAGVEYSLEGKKWVVRVNLNKQKIEEIKYSSDDNNKEKRENKK